MSQQKSNTNKQTASKQKSRAELRAQQARDRSASARELAEHGSRAKKLTPFTLPIPDFGKRQMTSRDFEEACNREGITVIRRRFTSSIRGFYMRQNGEPFIYIDSRLRGFNRLFVEFHELGHYFLHSRAKTS